MCHGPPGEPCACSAGAAGRGLEGKPEAAASRAARQVALGLAAARVGVGLTAVVMPKLVARPWVGAEAEGLGAAVLGRALGGRDIALGLGLLLAARRDRPLRGWLEAG